MSLHDRARFKRIAMDKAHAAELEQLLEAALVQSNKSKYASRDSTVAFSSGSAKTKTIAARA